MNHVNRVVALEAAATRPRGEIDPLSVPSLFHVCSTFALGLAHRHSDVAWRDLDDEQRRALMRVERDRLEALFRLHAPDDAVRRWLDGEHDELSHETFVSELLHHRRRMADMRGADNERGRKWRRRHPDWRRDLSPDEYIAFELALARETMR